MSKNSNLLKSVVKKSTESKPSFGTDPNDPWSTKANINESALLDRYLKSRGINPQFVSKDQKVAHSKTNQFKIWMSSHIRDRIVETVTQERTPTQKRLTVLKKAIRIHEEIRTPNGDKKLHSESVIIDRNKQSKYPNDPDTIKHRQDTAKSILSDPKSDPDSRRAAAAVLARKQKMTEAVDKRDTITFDIPLLIRVLEFAREDLKSDVLLHKMVERLLKIRGKGTLTMNEYGKIIKEEFEHLPEEQIDEISKELANRYMHSAMSDKRTTGISHALDRITKEEVDESYGPRADKLLSRSHSLYKQSTQETDPAKKEKMVKMSSKAHKVFMKAKEQHYKKNPAEYEKHRQAMLTPAKGWPTESTEVQGEPIQEVSSELLGRYKEKAKRSADDLASKGQYKKSSDRWLGHMKATGKQIEKLKKEDTYQDTNAATQTVFDVANNPDDTISAKQSTAKKVKLLLGAKKKQISTKTVKEEMYDHEKEDKSVASYGKKPKIMTTSKEESFGENKPKASAVLSGGKTMTGQPRDTVEIDPMMKKIRPGQFDPKDQKTNNK